MFEALTSTSTTTASTILTTTTTTTTTKRRKIVQNAIIALVLCIINIYTMIRVEFNFYRPNITSSTSTASTSEGSSLSTTGNTNNAFLLQSQHTRALVSNTNRLLRSTLLQQQYRNEFITDTSSSSSSSKRRKQQQQQQHDVIITIPKDDPTEEDTIEEDNEEDEKDEQEEQQLPRMLMGIFTTIDQIQQRNAYRLLLQQQNTKTNNICSLYEYQRGYELLFQQNQKQKQQQQDGDTTIRKNIAECKVIYTFVMGTANVMLPPMIVTNATFAKLLQNYNTSASKLQTIIANKENNNNDNNDRNEPDMTIFNIRENVNQGKSQTWFYYARKLIQQFDNNTTTDEYKIDYVMKTSVKTRFNMDRYYQFVDNTLPPRPYNRRILASVFSDKELWAMTKHHREKTERFHYLHYSTLHIYPSGQMYIVSSDLVHKIVTLAAANSKLVLRKLEHYEDHDIGLLAQLGAILESTDLPLTYIMIPQGDVFWTMNDDAGAKLAPKL